MTTRDHQLRNRIAAELGAARDRTHSLVDPVDDAGLIAQHSPLMSPLVWDFAHVGNQEELWLVRDVGGREPIRSDIDSLYDAFANPRRDRPALPLLKPAEARDYTATVRGKVLDILDTTPLSGHRLVHEGFAFGMIAQHEQQHAETMLATHQLRIGAPVLSAPPPPPSRVAVAGEVFIDGGPFTMGTSTEAWALDNERPAHSVELEPYFLDAAPVSNGQFADFIADGGYDQRRWWSDEGWRFRLEADLRAPLHWHLDGDAWWHNRFGRTTIVDKTAPVVHVSFHEAAAYAAWVGKRLPTEAEWEKAARFDPVTGRSRRYPWGDADPGPDDANLGQRHLSPAPIGAYPDGVSPAGVHQLIGDVWEWTDTDFAGYPGFAAFPYREYSQVFFNDGYKVLRGGSFGTAPVACRSTFRNWDFPIRRQIFAGFRCARSPGETEVG